MEKYAVADRPARYDRPSDLKGSQPGSSATVDMLMPFSLCAGIWHGVFLSAPRSHRNLPGRVGSAHQRGERMDRVKGKVALITGAARGMGEAAARALADEGATVFVTDVLDELGRDVATDLGSQARYHHLDVSSEEQWGTVVDAILAVAGRLDVLVNNAGVRVAGRTDTMSTEDYLRVVSVNQLGTFLGMRAVVSAMRASRGGSIVNTASSMAGTRGRPGSVAYTATKWAIRGMTRCAALDLAEFGIRVNLVHPGLMDTTMGTGSTETISDAVVRQLTAAIPIGRLGRPSEVARLVVFLASDEASYCTGAEFTADGGWAA